MTDRDEVRSRRSGDLARRLHWRWKYFLIGAVAGVGMLLTPPALGIGGDVFTFRDAAPERPNLAPDRAERVVAIKTRGGKHVAVWRGPSQRGRACIFLHVTADPQNAQVGAPNGGGMCAVGPMRAPAEPIEATVTWFPEGETVLAVVDGRVAPAKGIARVTLETSAGTRPLAFRRGHFLGELPAGTANSMGELAPGPLYVIGLSSSGSEVARLDLRLVVGTGTPD
jgi:hypothetical protein